MIREVLQEVRSEVPPFAEPAALAGVGVTMVLIVVMLIDASAGVAAALVIFSFVLLALASVPARTAWQEGTAWRQGESALRQTSTQVASAGMALFFLICAAAGVVSALGAHVTAAAVTFAICLGGSAVLGRRFEDTGWVEETRRAYGHVGWVPKVALAVVWLAVMTPDAISAYDHQDIRAGRVWEPAVRTLVAVLPLGWLLWESRLLRAGRPDDAPPLEPRSAH